MSSRGNTSFKGKLYNIMMDLNKIKPSDITLNYCINEKLSRSYEQYDNTMKSIYNYVLSRSNIKVIRALTKMKKKKESKNGN